MLNSKLFNFAATFVISWAVAFTVFPMVPGISFQGTALDAFLLTLGQTAIFYGIVFVGIITLLIGGLVYALRNEAKIKNSQISLWFLKQGYWKVTVVGTITSVLLTAFTWKIASLFSTTLAMDGFMPAVVAGAAILVGNTVFKLLTNPKSLSPAGYEVTLRAAIAKEQAEEEDKK